MDGQGIPGQTQQGTRHAAGLQKLFRKTSNEFKKAR